MPKMKTNKTALKKFRVNGKGKVKRAQAHLSHNAFLKNAKKKRKLRKNIGVDSANLRAIRGQLPYMNK